MGGGGVPPQPPPPFSPQLPPPPFKLDRIESNQIFNPASTNNKEKRNRRSSYVFVFGGQKAKNMNFK